MLKPCTDRLVVKLLSMKPRGLIQIPDNAKKELPLRALVLAVGPAVNAAIVDEVIVFHKFSGTLVELADGSPVVVLRNDDVLAIDPDVTVDDMLEQADSPFAD